MASSTVTLEAAPQSAAPDQRKAFIKQWVKPLFNLTDAAHDNDHTDTQAQ